MSNLSSIIDVFKMKEISKHQRADIIVELGYIINHEFARNISDKLVSELVFILDPHHISLRKENKP